MQLDAEDENFVPPAGVVAPSEPESNHQHDDSTDNVDAEETDSRADTESEARG